MSVCFECRRVEQDSAFTLTGVGSLAICPDCLTGVDQRIHTVLQPALDALRECKEILQAFDEERSISAFSASAREAALIHPQIEKPASSVSLEAPRIPQSQPARRFALIVHPLFGIQLVEIQTSITPIRIPENASADHRAHIEINSILLEATTNRPRPIPLEDPGLSLIRAVEEGNLFAIVQLLASGNISEESLDESINIENPNPELDELMRLMIRGSRSTLLYHRSMALVFAARYGYSTAVQSLLRQGAIEPDFLLQAADIANRQFRSRMRIAELLNFQLSSLENALARQASDHLLSSLPEHPREAINALLVVAQTGSYEDPEDVDPLSLERADLERAVRSGDLALLSAIAVHGNLSVDDREWAIVNASQDLRESVQVMINGSRADVEEATHRSMALIFAARRDNLQAVQQLAALGALNRSAVEGLISELGDNPIAAFLQTLPDSQLS